RCRRSAGSRCSSSCLDPGTERRLSDWRRSGHERGTVPGQRRTCPLGLGTDNPPSLEGCPRPCPKHGSRGKRGGRMAVIIHLLQGRIETYITCDDCGRPILGRVKWYPPGPDDYNLEGHHFHADGCPVVAGRRERATGV